MATQYDSVTVTLTRYAEPNWLFLETLDSLAKLEKIVARVLVLDQQDSEEIRQFCATNNSINIKFCYIVIPVKSLSFARNEAIRLCETDLLFYIDTDAVADALWAYELGKAMKVEQAAIAGGKITPCWHKKPGILQRSRFVLDQYSMLNLGDTVMVVNKVIGAGFAINITQLKELAHFDEELGRQNGKLLGGEETEMCAQARAKGLKVLYVGQANVHHQVMPERVRFSWVYRRMYFSGYSRALRGGKPEPSNTGKGLSRWDYCALIFLLPSYVAGYIRGKLD